MIAPAGLALRLRRRPAWIPRVRALAGRRGTASPPPSGPSAGLVPFALASLALLLVVAALAGVAVRRVATDEAVRDATTVTVALGHGVLRDRIDDAVLRGEPAALAALDRAVRAQVLGRPIAHLTVWTPGGRVVYADVPALIGRRLALPADLRRNLRDARPRPVVNAGASPVDADAAGGGRSRSVRVLLPLRIASGDRVLVEAAHSAGRIAAARRRAERALLPVVLVVLAGLVAIQALLAWAHARRERAYARARERSARDAAEAILAARGRLAAEVHDGVVQELTGVAYQMQAAAFGSPGAASDDELRGLLHRAATVCRGSMATLRDLVGDPRPAERGPERLRTALEALAGPLRARGARVDVDVRVDGTIDDDTVALLHRAARETLRSVHPRAGSVRVALRGDGAAVTLLVEDDGRRAPGAVRGGHARLALIRLADAFAERGGTLQMVSERGVGTSVRASLPRP